MILCDASCSFNSPPPQTLLWTLHIKLSLFLLRYGHGVDSQPAWRHRRHTSQSSKKRNPTLILLQEDSRGKKEEINRCIGPAAASRHEFFSSLSLSRGKKRERKKRRGKFWSTSDSCSLSPFFFFFLEYNDIKRFQKGLLCASSAVPTL